MRQIERGRKPRVFNKQLVQINTEIRRAYKAKPGKRPAITKDDLKHVFDKSKGRCRECGYTLTLRGQSIAQEARFQFIQPLKNSGMVSKDNLMLLCFQCKEKYRVPQQMLQRIPEVNTIADLIERLVVEKVIGNDEVVSALKRELNFAIEQAVDMLHYRPVRVSKTFVRPVFVEGENTIADTVEKMVEKAVEKEDTTGEHDQIEVDLQGVITEQKYRILGE